MCYILKMQKLKGFYKTLFIIALPIILQNMLQTLVNMLDTIMVGRLGSVEIAAVGLGNQVFFLLNMILFGISSGGSIFIAQYWGKQDINGIKKTLGITLSLSFIVSLVFFAGAAFTPGFILSFYSKDQAVIDIGKSYLRLAAFSYPLLAITFAHQLAFRSTEHVTLPMVSTMIAVATNALLNFLLIFGIGPFPKLGVNGAAIATILSRLIEFCITIFYAYSHHFEATGKLKEYLCFDKAFVNRFFKITIPVIINETLWGLGISAENAIFSHASTDAIASYNIMGTISQITWVFFIGVGNAAAIIIGKSIGQNNESLAKQYAFRFSWFMPVMAVFIGSLLYPLSLLLPYLFNVGENIIHQSQLMLRILMLFYPMNAFNMCFIVGICRSGGDTVYGAITDLLWLWVLAIPLGCAAAFLFNAEPYIIYLCLCAEQIAKVIAGLIRIKSGKWLHNVTI